MMNNRNESKVGHECPITLMVMRYPVAAMIAESNVVISFEASALLSHFQIRKTLSCPTRRKNIISIARNEALEKEIIGEAYQSEEMSDGYDIKETMQALQDIMDRQAVRRFGLFAPVIQLAGTIIGGYAGLFSEEFNDINLERGPFSH